MKDEEGIGDTGKSSRPGGRSHIGDPLPAAQAAPSSAFILPPSSFLSIALFDTDLHVTSRLFNALAANESYAVYDANLEDAAREIIRERHIDLLICSTRMRLFTTVRRYNPQTRIFALTVDGAMPGYQVCRHAERAFPWEPLPVSEIVAAVGLCGERMKAEG